MIQPGADGGYIGRFAPTPSGPLHFGSLIAALGSWLDARAHSGRWLLRIDDHDAPRCVPGSESAILRQLEAHGLDWDGAVYRESGHARVHDESFERLRAAGWLYPCVCTRKALEASPRNAEGETIYPGTCRAGLAAGHAARAWRVRVGDAEVRFCDAVHGDTRARLADDIGDFTVRRADGLYAYQFLCAVDDLDQGITHVVRGADLLQATARQIFLMRFMGGRVPAYAHLPVVTNTRGQKLSKQTRAPELMPGDAARNLCHALGVLGQQPPRALSTTKPEEILAWARAHWSLARVPRGPIVVMTDVLAENPASPSP